MYSSHNGRREVTSNNKQGCTDTYKSVILIRSVHSTAIPVNPWCIPYTRFNPTGTKNRIATLAIHNPHAILAQSQNPGAIEEHTAGEYRTREAPWAVRSPIAEVFQDCTRTEGARRRNAFQNQQPNHRALCNP